MASTWLKIFKITWSIFLIDFVAYVVLFMDKKENHFGSENNAAEKIQAWVLNGF